MEFEIHEADHLLSLQERYYRSLIQLGVLEECSGRHQSTYASCSTGTEKSQDVPFVLHDEYSFNDY